MAFQKKCSRSLFLSAFGRRNLEARYVDVVEKCCRDQKKGEALRHGHGKGEIRWAYLVDQTLNRRPQLVLLRIATLNVRKRIVELFLRGAPDVGEQIREVVAGLQLDFPVGVLHGFVFLRFCFLLPLLFLVFTFPSPPPSPFFTNTSNGILEVSKSAVWC